MEGLATRHRDPNAEFSLENLNDDNKGHAIVLELFDQYLGERLR